MRGIHGLLACARGGVLLTVLGCVACGGDGASTTDAGAGGTPGTGGDAPSGTGGVTGSGGAEASGGSDGSGGQPAEPFSIQYGQCWPNPVQGPEPIYENADPFAHIDALATHGDDLLFVESYDFNDPPPRIAILDQADSVSTLLDVGATKLTVLGDTLYIVDSEGLKSLDLTDPSGGLQNETLVTGIMAFSDTHVVYQTETEVFSIEIGQGDDVSSAVAMGPLDDVMRQPVISGGALYYHDVEDVLALNLDGSGGTQVTPTDGFRYIWFLAVDATHAYFDDNPLKKVPLAGGEPMLLGAAGPDGGQRAGFTDLAPTGDVVYWSDDTESWGWTATDGLSCGILGLHKGFFGGAVAVSSSYVYARGDAELYRVPRID